MPRPKATDIEDRATEDAYLSALTALIQHYKEFVLLDHPDADKLIGDLTKVFQIARRQHSLITALRTKREGSK